MKRYGTKTIKQQGVTHTVCDSCGLTAAGEPEDWFEGSTWHSDWGNDSVDSNEALDACSLACFTKVLGNRLAEYGEQPNPTFKVSLTILNHAQATEVHAALERSGEEA